MGRIRRDERGSSLVIALAFLALFSLWLTSTLTATESGIHVAHSMRVQPKRLYAADGAIERVIQENRYDPRGGVHDDDECGTPAEKPIQLLGQTVHVECIPDGNSGRGDEGESSPPVGIIGLSNGGPLQNEFAYQQYENSIVRLDGGVYSNTPMLFQGTASCAQNPSNCQQLNLCPRNVKTIQDGLIVRASPTVVSLSAPFRTGDVGVPIIGNGIPAGTTIAAYVNDTTVRMSRNATGTGTRVIRFREDYPRLQAHCHIPTEAEDPLGEHRRKGKATAVPRVPGPNAESCDQGYIVALQFNCDGAYTPDPVGMDPNYPPDNVSGFPVRTVPPCGDINDIRPVELQPGLYNDAVALSALTTGCDKLIWFKPGTYYFEFADANPVWTIGNSSLRNLTVVGGAKTWTQVFSACVTYAPQTNRSTVSASGGVFAGANGHWINAGYNLPYGTALTSVSGSSNSATFAGQPLTNNFGNCDETKGGSPSNRGIFTISPNNGQNPVGSLCDPSTNTDHPGVEFIFGKQSRLLATDGKFEICSPVVGTRQQIAIYGVKTKQARLEAQSGCILAQPYTPSGGTGCALVKAPQGSKPAFLVHGTIYAPNAAIDLSLQGVGYQIVSRGIIARVIALSVSPSANFQKPLIYSPNFGSVAGAPRKMVLTACLDRPCDAGGAPKLRTLVRIQDSDEFGNPGVTGFKVIIDSWAVL